MSKLRYVLMGLLACLLGVIMPVAAQSPTIITMTAPQYLEDLFEDKVIPDFEAQHPGIQVQFVYTDEMYSDPFYDEDGHFEEKLTEYASAADVLYVSSYNYSPYMTSTGYFLDLTPLVAVDGDLMPEDFYPAAWDAFQWDGGIWAIPTSIETQVLVYNQDRFDAEGLQYPNESWTFSDFIRTAEALHTYNDAGEVELPILNSLDVKLLIYGSIGDLVDDSVIPNAPDFSSPEFIDMLNQLVTYWSSYKFVNSVSYSSDEMAMYIGYPYQLAYTESEVNWQLSLLPGGIAGSAVEGYAISKGTAYPEAAYELVNFLSYNTDIFEYSFGSNPARRSVSVDSDEDRAAMVFGDGFTPEISAFLENSRENAVSPSALRFIDVVYRIGQGNTEVDINQILDEYEAKFNEAIARSMSLQSTQILVNPPVIRPDLAPGEVILTFGYDGFYMSGARDMWADVVAEFIADHPHVIDIELESDIYDDTGSGIDPQLDCYATTNIDFRSGVQGMLPLDPLLSTDFDFSANNFLSGVLEASQFNGLTYGYPLTIEPLMMWVNESKFEEAGVPVPNGSWTVNEFNQAIVTLGNMRDDPTQAIVRNDFYGVTGLMMLSAAYGGMPIDYGTNPSTYNLTDPQVLAALEQIINYIRDDNLISYQRLFGVSGGGFSFSDEYIIIDSLGTYGMFSLSDENSTSRPVMFPLGDLIPVSYQSLVGVITDTSLNVDDCYDWIKLLSQHPDLFSGVPADRSLIDSGELQSYYSDELISFYQDLFEAWSAPNVVPMDGLYGSGGDSQFGWLESYFFYYALDSVILDDGALELEMTQAQTNISLFRECTAGIEEMSDGDLIALAEEDEDAALNYYRQFIDCAVDILPALQEQFSYFYQ